MTLILRSRGLSLSFQINYADNVRAKFNSFFSFKLICDLVLWQIKLLLNNDWCIGHLSSSLRKIPQIILKCQLGKNSNILLLLFLNALNKYERCSFAWRQLNSWFSSLELCFGTWRNRVSCTQNVDSCPFGVCRTYLFCILIKNSVLSNKEGVQSAARWTCRRWRKLVMLELQWPNARSSLRAGFCILLPQDSYSV